MSNNSNLQLTVDGKEKSGGNIVLKIVIYVLCTFLAKLRY